MWTDAMATPSTGAGRRRRLVVTLVWTLIVSSVAAQATWGWAMNRRGAEWMPRVVQVVLDRVTPNSDEPRPEPSILEAAGP